MHVIFTFFYLCTFVSRDSPINVFSSKYLAGNFLVLYRFLYKILDHSYIN